MRVALCSCMCSSITCTCSLGIIMYLQMPYWYLLFERLCLSAWFIHKVNSFTLFHFTSSSSVFCYIQECVYVSALWWICIFYFCIHLFFYRCLLIWIYYGVFMFCIYVSYSSTYLWLFIYIRIRYVYSDMYVDMYVFLNHVCLQEELCLVVCARYATRVGLEEFCLCVCVI